jgi:hypothetical protein
VKVVAGNEPVDILEDEVLHVTALERVLLE